MEVGGRDGAGTPPPGSLPPALSPRLSGGHRSIRVLRTEPRAGRGQSCSPRCKPRSATLGHPSPVCASLVGPRLLGPPRSPGWRLPCLRWQLLVATEHVLRLGGLVSPGPVSLLGPASPLPVFHRQGLPQRLPPCVLAGVLEGDWELLHLSSRGGNGGTPSLGASFPLPWAAAKIFRCLSTDRPKIRTSQCSSSPPA